MNYITKGDTIIFGPSFNDELDYQLLTNYQRIIFSNNELNNNLFDAYENNDINLFYKNSCFNQSISNLPSSITHLTFGGDFNQSVDNLPSSIQNLTFGFWFNLPVDLLPSSITHLTFGDKFNQPVNTLPPLITHLTFGSCFNHLIDALPSGITHLTLGWYSIFDHTLNNLPPNLKFIQLPGKYQNKILTIPPKLQVIKCSFKYIYIDDFFGSCKIDYLI